MGESFSNDWPRTIPVLREVSLIIACVRALVTLPLRNPLRPVPRKHKTQDNMPARLTADTHGSA